MNNYSNEHLNVFQAFSQSGSLPIENNLSRGLVILFQEEPAFLMMFIDLIRTQLETIDCERLIGEYDVFFQMDTRSQEFEYYSKIIGVSLTAEKINELSVGYEDVLPQDKKYITDISIVYGEMLIVIEVKRTSENCIKQLKEQVQSIISNRGDSPQRDYVSLEWKDIVELLNNYFEVSNNRVGRLVKDYRLFILKNWPEWNTVEPLQKLDDNDESRISLRIDQIKQEYASEENVSINKRNNVVINDKEYVNEFALWNEKGTILFAVWIGDSGGQDKTLYRRQFVRKQFDIIKESVKKKGFDVSFEPYVKFAHIMGKGITSIHLKPELFIENVDDWKSFAQQNVGKTNNGGQEWENLLQRIKEKNDWWEEQDYLQQIDNAFNNKKFAFVSFGINIRITIPFKKAQELDSSNKWTETLKDLVRLVGQF